MITNNLNVAAILSDNPDCEVIVAGGIVRSRDRGIVGEATIDFIRQFKVDIGLIGISGIEDDGSLRDFDYREVKVARAIIEHSREVWLAADHSKFGRPAMVELARLDEIDRLFTDAAAARALSRAARRGRRQLHHLRGAPMTGKTHLLALDQGTSSSRSIVFAGDGTHRRDGAARVPPDLPAAGLGRARPARDLGVAAGDRARGAGAAPASAAGDIAAIGITNQRETTLLWNRAHRRAAAPTPSSGRTAAPRRPARR